MKVDTCADQMLSRIQTLVDNSLKTVPKFSGAIVDRVNEDGTVNIYFPPDKDTIFTNISNQTPFTLVAGDSVELTLKNGSYNNCWVSAKHLTTNKPKTDESATQSNLDIETIVRGHTDALAVHTADITKINSAIDGLKSRASTLESQVSSLQSSVSSLRSRVSTLESNYTALEARVKALEEKE